MKRAEVPIADGVARQERIVARVFTALGVACAAGGALWARAAGPATAEAATGAAFGPYLLALAAAPCLALAGALRVGAAVVQRSGEPSVTAPVDAGFGWSAIAVARPQRAVRDGAFIAFAIFLVAGAIVFTAYAARSGPGVSPLAVLAALAWASVTARLGWGTLARAWSSARVDDASLCVKPARPAPGDTLAVRVEQRPRVAGLAIRGITVTLVGERTWQRLEARRVRTRRVEIVVGRVRLETPSEGPRTRPLVVEHAFAIPAGLAEAEGFLRFRVDVRTHLRGPDYRTRFPLRMAGPD